MAYGTVSADCSAEVADGDSVSVTAVAGGYHEAVSVCRGAREVHDGGMSGGR